MSLGPQKPRSRRLREEIDLTTFLLCGNLFQDVQITRVLAEGERGISPTMVAFGTCRKACTGVPNRAAGNCPINITMKISFQHENVDMGGRMPAELRALLEKEQTLKYESRAYEYIYNTLTRSINTEEIYNFVPYVKHSLCPIVDFTRAAAENVARGASYINIDTRVQFIRELFDLYVRNRNTTTIPPDHILIVVTEQSGVQLASYSMPNRFTDDNVLIFTAQILISTKIMQRHNIQQNDMHTSNILLDASQAITALPPLRYITGTGNDLLIPMNHGKLLFFDWDLSMYNDVPNSYLDGYGDVMGKNNKADIHRSLSYMLGQIGNRARNFVRFWNEINNNIYTAPEMSPTYPGLIVNRRGDVNFPSTWPSIDELLNFPYFDPIRTGPNGVEHAIAAAADSHVLDIQRRISAGNIACNRAEAREYLQRAQIAANTKRADADRRAAPAYVPAPAPAYVPAPPAVAAVLPYGYVPEYVRNNAARADGAELRPADAPAALLRARADRAFRAGRRDPVAPAVLRAPVAPVELPRDAIARPGLLLRAERAPVIRPVVPVIARKAKSPKIIGKQTLQNLKKQVGNIEIAEKVRYLDGLKKFITKNFDVLTGMRTDAYDAVEKTRVTEDLTNKFIEKVINSSSFELNSLWPNISRANLNLLKVSSGPAEFTAIQRHFNETLTKVKDAGSILDEQTKAINSLLRILDEIINTFHRFSLILYQTYVDEEVQKLDKLKCIIEKMFLLIKLHREISIYLEDIVPQFEERNNTYMKVYTDFARGPKNAGYTPTETKDIRGLNADQYATLNAAQKRKLRDYNSANEQLLNRTLEQFRVHTGELSIELQKNKQELKDLKQAFLNCKNGGPVPEEGAVAKGLKQIKGYFFN